MPHGEEVHARRLRQLFIRILFEVEDGDRQAPAAAVALPGAEFLRSFEIGDLGAVRGKSGQARARNLEWFGGAALRGHQKEFGVAARRGAKAVRAEGNTLSGGTTAG